MTRTATTILVVDDADEVRGMVAALLRDAGFKTSEAPNVAAAKGWLSKNSPALIMLDVMMPDGNGLDLCRWVRAHESLSKVPIIIMTGIKDDETLCDALELGAMDFVRKPAEIGTIIDKVNRLLGIKAP